MNGFLKSFILVGAVASLSACASCPREGDYDRTPYGNRTSGSGVAIYDANCKRVVDTRPTEVRSEPRVFEEKMRK